MAQKGTLEEITDKKILKNLLEKYVPDVFQPNIHAINYQKLKESEIELITFDLDDTIMAKSTGKMSKKVPPKMTELKQMGFKVMLISNSENEEKVRKFAQMLNVDYISGAMKPSGKPFEETLEEYKLEGRQMAHVGNSIMNDVGGANPLGITTCLIRYVEGVPHNVIKVDDDIKLKLKELGMWQKHHIEQRGDQYYQVGETQKKSVK